MEIFNEQIYRRISWNREALKQTRDQMEALLKGKPKSAPDGDSPREEFSRADRILLLKRLRPLFVRCLNKRGIFIILLISLIVTLLGMYVPYVTKQIYQEIIPSGTESDLFPVLIFLLAAGIGSTLFSVTRRFMLLYLRYRLDANLQALVMKHTFNLPTGFFRRYSAGDLSNRVMAITQICQTLSDTVYSDFLAVLFSVGYFFQIFSYAPSLLGISLLILGGNLVLMGVLFSWQIRLSITYMPRQSALYGLQLSVLEGIQKIKTSGSEVRAFARVMQKQVASLIPVSLNIPVRYGTLLTGLMTAGGTLLIFLTGVRSHVALPDFMAFMAAYGAACGALLSLGSLLPKMANLRPLIHLARPLLEAEPENTEKAPKAGPLSGRIEVRNLSFRYSPDAPYMLKDLNLTIEPGEYVAIVGRSGCGKSTLIHLLLGFEKPESGSILYDTYDLANTQKQSIRQQIGTCLQDGQVFAGSIGENISITHPEATEEEIRKAAAMAAFDEDLREMPMGLHTVLSENGGNLSGGQRQRLLIARAVLGKPSILFFDEATSALDNRRQRQVAESLDRLHSTRICIAHRMSTILQCDRILVLDEGRIAEEGTFQELMDRRGLFYELNKRQL